MGWEKALKWALNAACSAQVGGTCGDLKSTGPGKLSLEKRLLTLQFQGVEWMGALPQSCWELSGKDSAVSPPVHFSHQSPV